MYPYVSTPIVDPETGQADASSPVLTATLQEIRLGMDLITQAISPEAERLQLSQPQVETIAVGRGGYKTIAGQITDGLPSLGDKISIHLN